MCWSTEACGVGGKCVDERKCQTFRTWRRAGTPGRAGINSRRYARRPSREPRHLARENTPGSGSQNPARRENTQWTFGHRPIFSFEIGTIFLGNFWIFWKIFAMILSKVATVRKYRKMSEKMMKLSGINYPTCGTQKHPRIGFPKPCAKGKLNEFWASRSSFFWNA